MTGDYCTSVSSTVECIGSDNRRGWTPITIIGWEFSDDVSYNKILFEGGAVGHNGQTPTCRNMSYIQLSTTSGAISCVLIAPAGVSGQWALRVQVGSTLSDHFGTPVVVVPQNAFNVTIAAPSSVYTSDVFPISLYSALSTYPQALHSSGSSVVFSIVWWDGLSKPANGASLAGPTSWSNAFLYFDSAAAEVSGLPTYVANGFRIKLPGRYVLQCDGVFATSGYTESETVMRNIEVLPSIGSVPRVISISGGCTEWIHTDGYKSVGTDCIHGNSITIIGENFSPRTTLTFSSTSVSCAFLWKTSIPPTTLVCSLWCDSPSFIKDVGVRIGSLSYILKISVFRPSLVATTMTSIALEGYSSGALVTIIGRNFALNESKNLIQFWNTTSGDIAIERNAVNVTYSDGNPPSCLPVSVTQSQLVCQINCDITTWGLWAVTVNYFSIPNLRSNQTIYQRVSCTSKPDRPPFIDTIAGPSCQRINKTFTDCPTDGRVCFLLLFFTVHKVDT